MTFVYFIIALSILIIVHEFGHFIVARLSGIRVEKFSVGFGPKIWGVKRGDTEYKVSILPFGGYVKMSGDDPADLDKNDEAAFYNKPVSTRARVVAAGPIMNLILCVILMPIVFMIGKSEPAFFVETPTVFAVKANSPAEAAGVRVGDVFVKVGDTKVSDWKDVLSEILISINQDIDVTFDREGQEIHKKMHVDEIPDGRGGYIGVEPNLFIGNDAVLDKVVQDSPAAKAGLLSGDKVLVINGKKIDDWTDMVLAINASGGEEISVKASRDGKVVNVRFQPEYDKGLDRYLIGVSMDLSMRDIPMTKVRYGFFGSIKEGMKEVYNLGKMTFTVLGRLVTLKLSYKALGGPIQIAQASAAAARSGIASFIFFLSFLSMQLGILNLLPIPVLDGGHLVFFGIEAVRKKPLSERVQAVAQYAGLTVILLLFVLISINDVMHIDTVREFFKKLF